VRVPADQLLANVLGDLLERPSPALLEQQREEVDLEEDVAQLVEQLGVVAAVRRVGQLVGLLDRVRDDRTLVLLTVPGALAPQPARQLVQASYRVAGWVGGDGVIRWWWGPASSRRWSSSWASARSCSPA
jgi:hypothetical protein